MDLNLANKERSEIQWEVINFSDSQKLLKITSDLSNYFTHQVRIISRFSWDDLQLIEQAVAIMRDFGITEIILSLPYMLGARSDRNFDIEHQAHYMRDVIAPNINKLGACRVVSMDPHSHVVEACIKHFCPLTSLPNLVEQAVLDISPRQFVLVAPDFGASKRTEDVAKTYADYNNFFGIIQCEKKRNIATGEILSLEVLGDPSGMDCIIVDDLIDGGGTFVGASKALKDKGATGVYLCIPHGIFSQGFSRLQGHLNKIYTTNSYQSKESMENHWKNKEGLREGDFEGFVSVQDVMF